MEMLDFSKVFRAYACALAQANADQKSAFVYIKQGGTGVWWSARMDGVPRDAVLVVEIKPQKFKGRA